MWRMAGRATHLALAQGMVRGLVQSGALGLMARRAHGGLRQCGFHRVVLRMHLVALHAGYGAAGMRAGCPVAPGIGLVATQAHRILLHYRSDGFRAEADDACHAAAPGLHVRPPGAVAGFALQSAMAEGTPRIPGARMGGAEDPCQGGLIVARQAGIGAALAVHSIGEHRLRGGGFWRGLRPRGAGESGGRQRQSQ